MKLKIRVVSIILCTAMLIGLLPAEQVFAADSEYTPDLLGITDSDWAIMMSTDSGVQSKIYTDKLDGEIFTEKVEMVDKSKLHPMTVFEGLSTGSLRDCGYQCVAEIFRRLETSEDKLNTNLWGLSTSGTVFNLTPTYITDIIGRYKAKSTDLNTEYVLTTVLQGVNVYTHDYFWTSQNDSGDVEGSYDDEWFFQRVFCNYIISADVFVYGSIIYIQNEGDHDTVWITGKMSNELYVYGLVSECLDDDGDTTDIFEDLMEDAEKCVKEFYNLPAIKQAINDLIAGYTGNLSLYSGAGPLSSSKPFNAWVESDIEDFDIPVMSWLSNGQNLSLASLALSLGYFGRGDFKCSDLVKCVEFKNKRVRIGVEGGTDYVDGFGVYINLAFCVVDAVVQDDTMINSNYSKKEISTSYFEVEDSEESAILMEEIFIPQQQLDFGEVCEKNIDVSGTGYWRGILTKAIGYSQAIRQASNYSNDNPDNKTWIASGSQHDIVKGFNNCLEFFNKKIEITHIESDTGDKAAALLNQRLKENYIEIHVNESGSSFFDWRTFAESGASTLEVSSVYEAMYMCAYIQYLRENSELSTLTHVTLNLDSKLIHLYYDESAIKEGFVGQWYNKDYKVPESEEDKFQYVTIAKNLYTGNVTSTVSAQAREVMITLTDTLSLTEQDYYLAIARTLATYKLLTGKELFGVASGMVSAVVEETEYTLNEDQVDTLKQTINSLVGTDFMYTGTAMNCLSYNYTTYLYGFSASRQLVGDTTVNGIPYYFPFDMFTTSPYNRANALAHSEYAKENSVLDYMPRLPLVSYYLTKEEQVLLYNVDYGLSVLDWSTYASENGTSASDLNSWFTSGEADVVIGKICQSIEESGGDMTVVEWAQSGAYDGLQDNYLSLFKIIINTYKTCETLALIEGSITWEDIQRLDNFDYQNVSSNSPEAQESYKRIKNSVEGIAKDWSGAVAKFVELYFKNAYFLSIVSKNLMNCVGGEFSYSTPIEPLGFVIKFEDEQLSAQWKYGYALSSMYVPFQTNVYEVAAIEEKADDTEWVTNFYYKYGFYRKALYITTDPNAVVNRYASGVYSPTKVATLRDLLNYNRDIELYVDQGFYNAGMLEEQLDRYIQNTNEGSVFGSIFDACNLTPESILKTGGYATYSSAIQAKVRPFGYEIAEAEKDAAAEMFAYEDFILSEDDILGEKGMLSAYDYTIQQPYGLVSAVYRSGTLFNTANRASVENKPVFVSSKNANAIGSYNKDLYRCFYNYLMLSAMEETIERETTLLVDLDAPIFIDIFGNIVTADGYVIIPAASNPTLVGENWVPYTVGFATYVNNAKPEAYKDMTYEFYDFLYGINYAAAIGKTDVDTYSSNFRDNQKEIGGGYFFLRQNGTSTLGTTNLTDGVASTTVNWDNPNTHVAALKSLLFSVHYLNTADMYNMTTVNMILEVLRGAPIEFIDYEEEGISSSHALTKMGATIAYMSEKLMNSVQTDSNGTEHSAKFSATLNVLDLFHIESAEKVALIAVKLLLIGFLILLAVQIIADASVGKMPVKTVGRIIVTCVLTGTCISLLPVLTEFSLSKMTQMLLQPEAAELLAMQAQRDSYGVEIGVTESYNTESSTDIIVKVGELDVQWYDLLLYSVYSSVDNSFTDLYNKAADGLPLAEASYTFTSGKNIYMDLSKIMDSTIVQYNGELGLITNERAREKTEEDLSASFLFPYYVFLDQLVANVNMYNKQNGTQPLSYSINSDGSIRTQDMTYAYFHSNEFMTTDYDILDLYRILNVDSYKLSYCSYFSDKDIVNISGSMWYPIKGEVNTEALTKSIEQLYQSARDYVTTNSGMLSYVSDGAYLKSLAMYLAVEYNSIFGIGIADAFELKCVDTKDMLRYTISNPKDVYKYANRSFSRYAFEVNGEWGAILATSLYVIMCVTNAIKVIAYVLTYTVAIWSIIYHRVFKRESDYSVYGFFILIGEITLLNVIYSVILKVMLNLTRWGVPGIASLVICILLQGLVILGFVALCFNGVKNVKELGQREIHRIQNIINNLNRDRSSRDTSDPNQPERTVAVLQAHDFSRQEQDNYNGDRANVFNLLEHDRRRESGQLGQQTEA